MSAIDSKKLKSLESKIKDYFSNNKTFKIVILIFLTIIITSITNRLDIYISNLLVFFILSIFALIIYFDNLAFFEKQFSLIEQVLRSIRNNRFLGPNEIILPPELENIENELKHLYKKNIDDVKKMNELEKLRTQFISNVSHELKTPLFAIQGFLETLKDGGLDDPNISKKYLEKALNNTYLLNQLINDIIELSKIESKEANMNFRYFNLKSFLESVVYDLDIIAEEKNLKLILMPVDENIEVYGDIHRIRQVMYNLISNSIKYTNEGKITIIVDDLQDQVKITVKDTGIGIPKKDLPYIFQRFYRVDKDRSRAMGGTGLGLAIVKHIIEAHKSKIEVKSVLGQGSEFSFYLKK